jgi:protein-L-isoaspartate(D-aspartate) O-methyltransferase
MPYNSLYTCFSGKQSRIEEEVYNMKKKSTSIYAYIGILLLSSSLIFCGNIDLKYEKKLKEMIQYQIIRRGVKDKKVIEAMRKVPRHLFVTARYKNRAYDDNPLPIGYGQTISQPYIVARMTELLKLKKDYNVLEIGTGSGYQAAILAKIVKKVTSVEIVKPLYERTKKLCEKLDLKNLSIEFGDGYYGFKKNAPYDAIIVTCASEFVPPPLIKQLKVGGIMCIPVGPPFQVQKLVLIEKKSKDNIITKIVDYVIFVPLIRHKK